MLKIPFSPHWKSSRLACVFDEINESNIDFSTSDALKFRFGTITKKPKYELTQEVIDTYKKYTKVRHNDIIINGLNLNYDFITQRVAIVEYSGIITSAYIAIRAKGEYNPRYYCYLFKSIDSRKFFNGMGTGIRLTLSFKELKNLIIPIPSRTEQDQIVRFLDWKVSSINKLISVKKKQLENFKELINKQFVQLSSQTNKMVRLKHLVELDSDFIQIQDDCYYIKTGMYNRGRGIFRREAILGKNMGDSSFQKIHAGRVMISGQFAWEAATYITVEEDEIGVASHRYYLLNPTNAVPSEYIWCYLMTEYGQLQMKLCSHGAAGRNRPLNIKELLNIYIPIPNFGEDLNILVQNVQNLMKLSINLNNQEKILEELKSRLISDTVTGKVDIRDVEIPDYGFMDENISFDNEDEPPEEDLV